MASFEASSQVKIMLAYSKVRVAFKGFHEDRKARVAASVPFAPTSEDDPVWQAVFNMLFSIFYN